MGQFLAKLALQRTDLVNFVEIGTWKGMGSTYQITKSLEARNDGSSLVSFEIDNDFLSAAINNYKWNSSITKLVKGRVSANIMSLADLHAHPLYIGSVMDEWLAGETVDFNNATLDYSLVPPRVDFILLDGGEFSTFYDWQYLKALHPRVVALTCINVLKANGIFNELKSTAQWKLLSKGDEFQGWVVFERTEAPTPEPVPPREPPPKREPPPAPEQAPKAAPPKAKKATAPELVVEPVAEPTLESVVEPIVEPAPEPVPEQKQDKEPENDEEPDAEVYPAPEQPLGDKPKVKRTYTKKKSAKLDA
jgi:hypothetical protein